MAERRAPSSQDSSGEQAELEISHRLMALVALGSVGVLIGVLGAGGMGSVHAVLLSDRYGPCEWAKPAGMRPLQLMVGHSRVRNSN